MSDYNDGDNEQNDSAWWDDEIEGWEGIPDDAIQNAIDAFNLFDIEFDRDSIASVDSLDDWSGLRMTGYETVADALEYWLENGFDDIPDFADLYYDPYDDMWYWDVDEDST